MAIRKFKFEKLGRDRVLEVIRARGITVHERQLSEEEYVQKLKQKVVEEAGEVAEAKSREALVEECADVYEVLYALLKAENLSSAEVEKKRLEKREKYGGFEQKRYVTYIEIDENNPRIEYFRASPHKYPEIMDGDK